MYNSYIMEAEELLINQTNSFLNNDLLTFDKLSKKYEKLHALKFQYLSLFFKSNNLALKSWKLIHQLSESVCYKNLILQYQNILQLIKGLKVNESYIFLNMTINTNLLWLILSSYSSKIIEKNLSDCLIQSTLVLQEAWKFCYQTDVPTELSDLVLANESFSEEITAISFKLLKLLTLCSNSINRTSNIDVKPSAMLVEESNTFNDMDKKSRIINLLLHSPNYKSRQNASKNLWHLYQAITFFKSSDFDRSFSFLDQMKENSWNSSINYFQAQILFKQKKYLKSLTLLSYLKESSEVPKSLIHLLCGQCFSALSKPYSAIQQYKLCLEHDIRCYLALNSIVQEYDNLGKHDVGLEALDLLIQLMETCEYQNVSLPWYSRILFEGFDLKYQITKNDVIFNFASLAMKLRYYEKALKNFEKLMAISSKEYSSINKLSVLNGFTFCLYKLNRFNECLDICNKETSHHWLSELNEDQDNGKNVKKRVHCIDDDNLVTKDQCELFLIHYIKAVTLFKLEMIAECISSIDLLMLKLLRYKHFEDTNSIDSSIKRKKIKLSVKDDTSKDEEDDKILVSFDQALKAHLHLLKGIIFEIDFEVKALNQFKSGLFCNPGNESILLKLTNLQLKMNRKTDAIETWKWAKKLSVVAAHRIIPDMQLLSDDTKDFLQSQMFDLM